MGVYASSGSIVSVMKRDANGVLSVVGLYAFRSFPGLYLC